MEQQQQLTPEQITKLHERNIGVVSGLGTGLGGSLMAAFMLNPVTTLSISSEMPTDEEIELLQSYVKFRATTWYGERVAEMPIPQADGAVVTIFTKGGYWRNGKPGWGYRRQTWTSGPIFWPATSEDAMSLVNLIEHIEQHTSYWAKWKERVGA